MFRYIYIDESGDLGLSGSKYLVLAAVAIDDYSDLDRIIKNMRRNKFKKQLWNAHEIKANKSSKDVIKYMLKKLNGVENARVFYIVLEKRKIISEYLKNNKHRLYNYVAGKLARQIPLNDVNVVIRIDKSKGKQLLQHDFNDYFIKNLKEKSAPRKIEVLHSYSHAWSGLQFADVLAWSCFQKFERDNNEYVDLIAVEQEVYHVW